MELSFSERWILLNQFRILSIIDPESSDDYELAQKIVGEGFEGEYEECSRLFMETTSKDACLEVRKILFMFSILETSYSKLPNKDKEGISDYYVYFRGFSGNEETKYFSYAMFLCEDMRLYKNLIANQEPDGFNSHSPMLPIYRGMREVFEEVNSNGLLTREQIIQITSTKE